MIHSISRRFALAFGFLLPFAARGEARQPRARALLVDRARRANDAFIRGDMQAWFELVSPISADFTLMQPFGGAFSRGFDGSAARLDEMARYFKDGRATLEIAEIYETPDMVVLAIVERQTGEVGGLPDQDWSLRVTQVYRRRGEVWELVHRHADPLVRHIGLDTAAALARGDLPG